MDPPPLLGDPMTSLALSESLINVSSSVLFPASLLFSCSVISSSSDRDSSSVALGCGVDWLSSNKSTKINHLQLSNIEA
jgi:hypothetical protein